MKPKSLKTTCGQTAMEYLLLVSIVAFMVFVGFGKHGFVSKVHDTAQAQYDSTARVIMGEDPAPIPGKWCEWSLCSGSPAKRYRTCECPAPAFGGACENGLSEESCCIRNGNECGSDGCGGTRTCASGYSCSANKCVAICVPNSNQCGPDGCGGNRGSCDDGTTCTNGRCVANCVPNNNQCGADGCGGDHGNCTGNNICNRGQCVPPPQCRANSDCNDGKSCTRDVCYHPGAINSFCGAVQQCPSGQACNISGACSARYPKCSTDASCNDGKSCTTDFCAFLGTDNASCANSVNCMSNQTCNSSGVCAADPVKCRVNGDCNDGKNCTRDVCYLPGTPNSFCAPVVNCPSGQACNIAGECSTRAPSCVNDASCDDEKACTSDFCAFIGTDNASCIHSLNCPSGQSCNSSGTCSLPAPVCRINSDCNDRKSCTRDVCYFAGTQNAFCAGVLDCPSGQACNGVGDCSTKTPACYNDAMCDDGNSCTTDICTFLGTDNASCANSVNCPQGQSCNSSGACAPSDAICSSNSDCNDGKSCTRDVCYFPGTSVSFCAGVVSCPSGQSCNIAGSCSAKVPMCFSDASCDDEKSCTSDFCASVGTDNASCIHSVNCTSGEGCDVAGQCTLQ